MPDVRLIDAKKLIKDIAESIKLADEWKTESHKKQDKHGLKCAIDTRRALLAMISRVKDAPTIDAQPVKHGRWEETHISLCKWIPEDENEEGHSFYMAELKCSCCERYNVVTFALTLNKPEFCQLCGARMDGDDADS